MDFSFRDGKAYNAFVEVEHVVNPHGPMTAPIPQPVAPIASGAIRYPVINDFYSRRAFATLLSLWPDFVPSAWRLRTIVIEAIAAIITAKGTLVRLAPSRSCRMISTGSF